MKLFALTLLVVASVVSFASPPGPQNQANENGKPRTGTYFESVQHLRR